MSGKMVHGLAGTPIYKVWGQIKNKCTNSKYPKYKGKMFEPWVHSFAQFYADVGPRPSPRHKLSRIQQEGAYAPSNVHWVLVGSPVEEPQQEIPNRIQSLIGRQFGRLLVQSVKSVRTGDGNLYYRAVCLCSCGKLKEVFCHSLTPTKSCGCDKSRYLKTTGPLNYKFKGFMEIRAGFWSGYQEGATRRRIEFGLTIEYAWALFEKQERRCALSGVPLVFSAGKNSRTTASLDRVDCSKGYVEGNVQWVHKNVNLMRNALTIEDFVEWCHKVVVHHSSYQEGLLCESPQSNLVLPWVRKRRTYGVCLSWLRRRLKEELN